MNDCVCLLRKVQQAVDLIEFLVILADIAEEASDDPSTRKGRFRICSPNSPGPPETSHGRFRISPQGEYRSVKGYIDDF